MNPAPPRTKSAGTAKKRYVEALRDESFFLVVLFPAFNEAANIEPLVRKAQRILPEAAQTWEIIPVNDGSTDGTEAVIARLAAEDPRHIRPVNHRVNQGYGGALISGFKNARFELIFFTDGDGQFDIGELPLLLEKAGEADLIIGFRKNCRDPLTRSLNGFMWGQLVRMLFGFQARDVNCGFKLVKATVMDAVKLSSAGAMISTELLAKTRKKGFRRC